MRNASAEAPEGSGRQQSSPVANRRSIRQLPRDQAQSHDQAQLNRQDRAGHGRSVNYSQVRREKPRQEIRAFCHAKGEGHAGTDLAGGLAIDARAAQPKVNCNIVLDLPDRADQGGAGSKQANIALVEEFGNRPHWPVMRTLDNAVEKVISVLLAGELNLRVEVDRSPVRAVRNDAVEDCSGPMLIIDPRQ